MTTPWKTWMRERLPSTTRTWTLTVSPGRNSGMSSRNESASSASRVFISAVLSPSGSQSRCGQRYAPAVRSGELWLQGRSSRRVHRRPAAALYCATSSVDDARRPRRRPLDQLLERVRQPRWDERLVAGADLRDAPPAVRLVLVGLDLGLAAHVDLVDDVP